jgi:hypothetical protein
VAGGGNCSSGVVANGGGNGGPLGAQRLQGPTPPRLHEASHLWNSFQNLPWQRRSRRSRYV